MEPDDVVGVAEAAWRWVLDQVRWDDGPWVPASVSVPAADRPWTAEEQRLADGIVERVQGAIAALTDPSYFDGLVSSIGVLIALEAPGADAAVARLAETRHPGRLAAEDQRARNLCPQILEQRSKYVPNGAIMDP